MGQVGQFSLALAFVVTIYSIAASLLGIRIKNDRLIASGRNAAVAVFVLISTAIGTLAYLFVTNDFAYAYVTGHSNRDLPTYFKISSIWGGQEGSLLFWGWLLTIYTALVVIQNRRKHMAMMPYVTSVLMGTSLFFTSMHLFVANPFKLNAAEVGARIVGTFTPGDGQGLNALLQDPMMVIHPPMLYLGFVGMVVPFAFAIAALITRQLGDTWIRTTRRWTMAAWGILGTGILLGGFWAYHTLGWGGYWAWDPVENASLMPWLIGTAFLHSVMVQEKKGMLKVWNIVLVIMCYIMAVFGTFLTRSGVVNSVHAFAKSPIGGYFLAFIVIALSGSFYLLIDRLPYLKNDRQMESVVSRESSFLFNNLVLLVACFSVLFGTMLPSLSDWITGNKITVSRPFFDAVDVPIAIFLLFLTGVGPLLAWRKASTNSLKRNFMIPTAVALFTGAVMLLMGVRHFYAWIALVMAVFVGTSIIREFYKGAHARSLGTGENFAEATVNLTLRNTRRYGGYIAHMGFVLLFVGWAGQAFTADSEFDAGIGDTFQIRNFTVRVNAFEPVKGQNYSGDRANVSLYKDGTKIASMFPGRRNYNGSDGEQAVSEIAIRESLREDVYLVFQGPADNSGKKGAFHIYLNPLVAWVWIGGVVLGLGTIVALLPNNKATPSRRRKEESEAERTVKEGPLAKPIS
jgi:cytochrome c-type biogenesis protein CcmF